MIQLTLTNLLIIFLGGGIGATLRAVLTLLLNQKLKLFWSGTLFVNITGCIILFLLCKLFQGESKTISLFIKIGILGSLTTFSTLSFELVTLFKQGLVLQGMMVLLMNLIFGLSAGFIILR